MKAPADIHFGRMIKRMALVYALQPCKRREKALRGVVAGCGYAISMKDTAQAHGTFMRY